MSASHPDQRAGSRALRADPRATRRLAHRCARVALALLPLGCAHEDLRPDYEGARTLIAATTGAEEVYDPERGPLGSAEIEAVLAGGLSLDEALRLALLNSRRLQAGFMELGIARADYVQAGLLQNPTLGLALLFPSGGGRTRLVVDLAQDVMDLWRLPERRALAAAGMEQRVLQLGRQAGELLADSRAAYIEAVAARESRRVAQSAAELSRRATEAVGRRLAAGVATEVEASLAQSAALAAALDEQRLRVQESATLRRLAGLLSLVVDLREVPLTDGLPPAPAVFAEREVLVRHACEARLDLRALAAAIAFAEARLEVERGRATPDVSAGAALERPESSDPTDLVAGPVLSVELPLFDGNEAGIRRAEYELEVARRTHEALVAEAAQDVRAAVDRAQLAAVSEAFVREQLLPQAERGAGLARTAFDLGHLPLLSLLEAERAVVQARAAQVEAAREVALALSDLERVVGGPLPAPARAAREGQPAPAVDAPTQDVSAKLLDAEVPGAGGQGG